MGGGSFALEWRVDPENYRGRYKRLLYISCSILIPVINAFISTFKVPNTVAKVPVKLCHTANDSTQLESAGCGLALPTLAC